jgi:membrane-bound lytic murein transglycosylase D
MTRFLSRISSVVLLLMALATPSFEAIAAEAFVRPAELEADITFWRRIYTEVSTNGGLIHDPYDLGVVYEVLEFADDLPPRQRSKYIEDAKQKYSRMLERIASGADDLSAEEQRVAALWPKGTHRLRFEQAAEEVRFQLGQSDRFREGVLRSGAYRDHIADTFAKTGLPRELAALPHVESSFNTYAYSKVGAAGMWQFMRATGRRFLRIDNTVDERLDPYRATEAAARFLEQNYIVLKSWPLALTAYNHGTAGMRRAQEQMGTSDITTIVRKYNSRSFGFASRNFYVAFLAALEVDSDPDKFFGPIKRNPVDDSKVVTLTSPVSASRIAAALNIERDVLKRLNPALLPVVWSGSRHVPQGFELRVPSTIDPLTALERIHSGPARDVLLADAQHRVRKGDTLSTIAARYGVPASRLAELNSLRKPYRLGVGQVLDLPSEAAAAPPTVAQAEKPPVVGASAKVAPTTGVVGNAETRYVVKRGDSLSSIAKRHGMTEGELMQLNSVKNRNFIYEGQVLALSAAARVAPPEEASVPLESATPAPLPEPVAVAEAVEPVTEREAEELGSTLIPGMQAAASADPSDYTVAKDQTVRVQAAETIGHYAEWLDVRADQLRKLNRMTRATPVVIGRKVKMDFSRVTQDQFEARRIEYHKQLQETFFTQYRISGDTAHVIKSGESVWVLAQQRYNVPIWLLRQYNPDLDIGSLRPGAKLVIPTLVANAPAESATP